MKLFIMFIEFYDAMRLDSSIVALKIISSIFWIRKCIILTIAIKYLHYADYDMTVFLFDAYQYFLHFLIC